MANWNRKKRRKKSKKQTSETPHASLAAMAPILEQKGIFQSIHEGVVIPQKTFDYTPCDKLVLVILSELCGHQTLSEVNWTLRVDEPLLMAFGYEKCPDQSVLQATLNAATAESVSQLSSVASSLFAQHGLFFPHFQQLALSESVTIDFDLTAGPCSKQAEGAKKGYFANHKNSYGRQLARVLVAETSEIVLDQLYSGNQVSCTAFKEMVYEMEGVLSLDEKANRMRIRLRLDGGFGSDDNINFALSRGYGLLIKMYSGNRARVLAESVEKWVSAPTQRQREKGENATREAAFLTKTHRYCRKTRQVAIRTSNPKNKSGYSYRVIVTTDLDDSLQTILDDYDERAGVPESLFCQDNQGLAARKRRKRRFFAQQMLMHLTQIAHNLTLWIKQWQIDAIDFAKRCDDWIFNIMRKWNIQPLDTTKWVENTQEMIRQRGIKRFTHQLFALAGSLSFRHGKLHRIVLKAGYPMIDRITLAFAALLDDTGVEIAFAQT